MKKVIFTIVTILVVAITGQLGRELSQSVVEQPKQEVKKQNKLTQEQIELTQELLEAGFAQWEIDEYFESLNK